MPNADQQQLMIALFVPKHDTVAEWQKWRASTDLDTIDLRTQRLIPLLHERLSGKDRRHGDEGSYRGVHRYWWLRNGILRLQLAELIAMLGGAVVDECLILGGIALVDDVYASLATRPVIGVDLMIRAQGVPAATGTLRLTGFRSADCRAAAIESPWLVCLTWRQSENLLRSQDRGDLRLSWTAFGGEFDIEGLWHRAEERRIGGARVLKLGATGSLLQICVGGGRWSDVRPLRWVPDALLLIHTHDIDWDQLIDQARHNGLALPLSVALNYLSATFGASVSASVLSRFPALPVSQRNLQRHRARTTGTRDFRWRRAVHMHNRYRPRRKVSSQGSLLHFVRIMRSRSVEPGQITSRANKFDGHRGAS
jgi:hypothetical protein